MNATLRKKLISAESYFRKACEQVFVLNRHVEETTQRFNDAEVLGNKVLRYNLRLRLSVLEGVRNMFYEFAAKKATEITQLQRHILNAHDFDVNADDSDSDVSELAFGATSDTSDAIGAEDGLELC